MSIAIKVLKKELSKEKTQEEEKTKKPRKPLPGKKKMPKKLKLPKQLTLGNLPKAPKKEPARTTAPIREKLIVITEIGTLTKEDELALKVGFKLFPSKNVFSKVQSDLWFDEQQISSVAIRIPQGHLAADDFEFSPVLDMRGIPAGSYIIKVEMYELWSSGEKLSKAVKEVTVEYVPQTRQSRFVKVPIVKSVAGTDLVVVSELEKDIYRRIEKTIKKEYSSKRDDW
jgi:hypothetical protein